ncbi:MAG TPA: sensor histidine kinase [Nitrosopumilaceae archaeon]|nr:sensor histidine kinase [Nitrosopumilaceae archaeon]
MKISFVIIAVMFAISLTFTVVGLVTFDLSVQEIKKLLGSRNEGFAFNMVQGLDKHIEKRISEFKDLTNLSVLHSALLDSNEEFLKIEDVKSFLNIREQDIEFTGATPFISGVLDENLTKELVETIEFYRDQYNYDVIDELFVTNAYGANVALGSGTSDYSQSDEQWWQIAKDTGSYFGEIQFNENYDSHSIDFAFRINDVDGNFIGVLRVLITLDDLLNGFSEEADIITLPGRTVLLLDESGNSIYSDKKINLSDSIVSYFSEFEEEKDSGFFEIDDGKNDLRLVSYAKSSGYRTFEGFGWIVVVEQNNSSLLQEFVELRDSILAVSIFGMLASIIGGFLISSTVSAPLRRLTKVANSISKGNFDVSIRKSRIDEIKTIGDSFEDMTNNLKKLIETEKHLAEAHVKIKNERLVAIGELAASMAHDMKNPLATIKSSAQILQKTKQDGELNEVINRMNRAIDRMSHQINDVLNYVRITPLEKIPINLNDLLESAKNSLDVPNNISLLIPESNITINGDLRKLEIVFINIFLNSIQAIGNSDGKINCDIKEKDSTVVIEIQDSGPGIHDNVFTKIFDPLVTSKQKGTGLGLSTCKNIIEQHNGTITAQNNPTRFTIVLPIF